MEKITFVKLEEIAPYFDEKFSRIEKILSEKQTTGNPFEGFPELLTRKEVAKIMGWRSLATVDNYVKSGKLNKHRQGRTIRFKKAEVIKFFAK